MKRPLRYGEIRLYSHAKKGSGRGKGWPTVVFLQCVEFTQCHRYFWKVNERTFYTPKVLNDLDDSIKVPCIKKRISNHSYGQYQLQTMECRLYQKYFLPCVNLYIKYIKHFAL